MKKKVVGIFVCMLVTLGSGFTVVVSSSVENQILVTQGDSSKQGSNTLITEFYYGNRVIEIDSGGNIIWQKAGLNNPLDAERLTNGNTLITEGDRVTEVDAGGTIVWQYGTGLIMPFDAERLENGNTLIAGAYSDRVIEVDSSGSIVWEKTGLEAPVDAERLDNGNTLIVNCNADSVIEVDSGGNIVWQKTNLNYPNDAERLANGNTLITELHADRVIEVDSGGNIVWEKDGLYNPWDAERLDNGNTLISDFGQMIEVDTGGTIVWQYFTYGIPTDAERISNPPDAPIITGQISGKPGVQYEYTFNAIDPDSHNVRYIINWGDDTSDTTGYYPSGTDAKVKHTWSNEGTYIITAKAQDIHGFEGPEGKLTVTIPRSREVNNPLLLRLFERFPLLEKLLTLFRVI